METVNHIFERDSRRPLNGLLRGELPRTLLLQIQHLKVRISSLTRGVQCGLRVACRGCVTRDKCRFQLLLPDAVSDRVKPRWRPTPALGLLPRAAEEWHCGR